MTNVREEPIPLNLRKIYGNCFKIVLDESAFLEPGGKKDPWYFQIPCKYGHLYPYSDKRIAFYCESGKVRARLLRNCPELEVRQCSDIGEAVFLFTPEQFDIVAEYARPRKKRRLSNKHKEKFIASGVSALKKHKKSKSNWQHSAQESTKSVKVVLGRWVEIKGKAK